MTEKGDDLQREALDTPRITLADLAEQLGRSPHTVTSYRLRRREMPSDVRTELASILRDHADELRKIAKRLDLSAK